MSKFTRHSHKSAPRGFTLIEIMVVIAIIVILAGILLAVGSQIQAKAKINYTKTTLKTLDGLMKDYLSAGNPEPTIPSPWPYAATNPPLAEAKTKTLLPIVISPDSDPINWVKALRSSPEFAKKLSNLKTGVDSLGNVTIVDGFGTQIRYIPYNANTKREGYFQSAGPDRTFSNEDITQLVPAPLPGTPAPLLDDIYSTDP